MDKLNIQEIVAFSNGKLIKTNKKANISYISTDSRDIKEDTLYIPIIGENLDGHIFLEDAYNNGCRSFIIDCKHSFNKNDVTIIQVEDTTLALGMIAKGYKEKFLLDIVAVTGSVGKTTTKDMIYSVLKTKYNTLKTEGNFNNEIGLPKMLFKINNSYEMAVLEMGMGKKGDIRHLVSLAKPHIAVISNIGLAHIEFFPDGQDGIFNAKMEIADFFDKDSILIVNGDDEYLKKINKRKYPFTIYTYGFDTSNDIYCTNYTINEESICFKFKYCKTEHTITIPTSAKHNIYNAMASILVGLLCNIPISLIKEGLSHFELTKDRLDIIKTSKYKIINDTYNANYDSMASALDVLSRYHSRRVAILGDMFELGTFEKQLHEKVGDYVKNKADILITIGNASKYISDNALKCGVDKNNIYHFKSKQEFFDKKNKILKQDDTILIKASHGINFFEIVSVLKNEN